MEYIRRIDTKPKEGISSLYRRKLPTLTRLKLWIYNVLR